MFPGCRMRRWHRRDGRWSTTHSHQHARGSRRSERSASAAREARPLHAVVRPQWGSAGLRRHPSELGRRHEEGPTSPCRAQQQHNRDRGRRDHQQRTLWTEHPAGQPVGPGKAAFEWRQLAPVLNAGKRHATEQNGEVPCRVIGGHHPQVARQDEHRGPSRPAKVTDTSIVTTSLIPPCSTFSKCCRANATACTTNANFVPQARSRSRNSRQR